MIEKGLSEESKLARKVSKIDDTTSRRTKTQKRPQKCKLFYFFDSLSESLCKTAAGKDGSRAPGRTLKDTCIPAGLDR